MGEFDLRTDGLDLPPGAFAGARRHILTWRGRTLLGITEGTPRCYIYPVLTLAGFAVTAEGPADHPHHNSIWVAADHVHARVATAADRHEDYTYNFYVNSTFQGRAPGRQVQTALSGHSFGPAGYRLVQEIDWRGPSEWAAAEGRVVFHESRTITVTIADDERDYAIDVSSTLSPAQWDVTVGPTRHAFFNARVADAMRARGGVELLDSVGRRGPDAINAGEAEWVCASGPVGGGHDAAVVVAPGETPRSWFVTDWGVVTVGTMREAATLVAMGDSLHQSCRFLIHDGRPRSTDIPGRLVRPRSTGKDA